MKITKFSIDIKGYRRNIFTYVVLILLNPGMIELLWIKKDNIIIKPDTDTLIINSYGLIILIKICHGASCMQANDAKGQKNDRLGKERRKEKERSN